MDDFDQEDNEMMDADIESEEDYGDDEEVEE
jgi:hypothetical protein